MKFKEFALPGRREELTDDRKVKLLRTPKQQKSRQVQVPLLTTHILDQPAYRGKGAISLTQPAALGDSPSRANLGPACSSPVPQNTPLQLKPSIGERRRGVLRLRAW